MVRPANIDPEHVTYDFKVRLTQHGRPICLSKAYWKISARMKPYLSFALTINGQQYRATAIPQSILSHPDGALFEKILWRERVLSGDPVEFPEPIAGEDSDDMEPKPNPGNPSESE